MLFAGIPLACFLLSFVTRSGQSDRVGGRTDEGSAAQDTAGRTNKSALTSKLIEMPSLCAGGEIDADGTFAPSEKHAFDPPQQQI
jgi:hypothetical protein